MADNTDKVAEKVEHWFEGKIGLFLQLGSTVVGITVVILTSSFNTELLRKDVLTNQDKIAAIQQEITLINTNHLTHIQASIQEICIQVAKLSTQLDDHLRQSK